MPATTPLWLALALIGADAGPSIPQLGLKEVAQYLRALKSFELTAKAEIRDGSGEDVKLGPVAFEQDTVLDLHLTMERTTPDGEAVLRSLTAELSKDGSFFSLIDFRKLEIDKAGDIFMSGDFLCIFGWSARVTKITPNGDESLDMHVEPQGLARLVLTRQMRITSGAEIQYLSVLSDEWNTLQDFDFEIKVPSWPPRASDLLEWLPAEKKEAKAAAAPGDAASPKKQPKNIPIAALELELKGTCEHVSLNVLSLQDVYANTEFELRAHGSFQGRKYISGDGAKNTFTFDASAKGVKNLVRLEGKTKFSGTHREKFDFDDLKKYELWAGTTGKTSAVISEVAVQAGPAAIALGKLAVDVDLKSELAFGETQNHDAANFVFVDRSGSSFRAALASPATVKLGDPAQTLELIGKHPEQTLLTAVGRLYTDNRCFGLELEKADFFAGPASGSKLALEKLSLAAGDDSFLRLIASGQGFLNMPDLLKNLLEGGPLPSVDELLARVEGRGQAEISLAATARDFRFAVDDSTTISVPKELRVVISAKGSGSNERANETPSAELGLTARVENRARIEADGKNGKTMIPISSGTQLELSPTRFVWRARKLLELETAGHAQGKRGARLTAQLRLDEVRALLENATAQIDGPVKMDLVSDLGFRLDDGALSPISFWGQVKGQAGKTSIKKGEKTLFSLKQPSVIRGDSEGIIHPRALETEEMIELNSPTFSIQPK